MKNVNIKDYNEKNFVDILGNVYSVQQNGSLLKRKLSLDRYGYLYVALTKNSGGEQKKFKVHRIVALTYLENPENKPTVNHKDGNKLNNKVTNLEFSTNKEQSIHRVKELGQKQSSKLRTIYVFNNDLEFHITYSILNLIKINGKLKFQHQSNTNSQI